MNKYRSTMDKIAVTPEMKARILKNVSTKTEQKTEIKKLPYPQWISPVSAIAACCAIIVAAVIICPSLFSGNGGTLLMETPQISDTSTQPGGVQASGSPIENIAGIDRLKKTVPFELSVPRELPTGYQIENTSVFAGKLAQIIYSDGSNKIVYREAKGAEDVSGDFTSYDVAEDVKIDNAKVTLKGSQSLVNLATWTKDGCSFSLSFSNGIEKTAVATIIESMEKA